MKINCQVAGITFRKIDHLPEGQIWLEAEKDNKYDPLAVKVMWGNDHVGYLPTKSEAQKMFHSTPVAVGIIDYSFSRGVDQTTGEREFNKEGVGQLASIMLWISGKSPKKFMEKDGKKYQRITNFLDEFEFEGEDAIARLNEWKRTANHETAFKMSAKLGTIIHELAEEIAGGRKSRITRFLEKHNLKPVSFEQKVYDDDLGLGGTYDADALEILEKGFGDSVMLDWKSATEAREHHKYQVAFYAYRKGYKKAMIVALGSKNKCGYKVYAMDEQEIKERYEVVKCLKKGVPHPPTKFPITLKKHD